MINIMFNITQLLTRYRNLKIFPFFDKIQRKDHSLNAVEDYTIVFRVNYTFRDLTVVHLSSNPIYFLS